jgi:hypothetical protein
LEPWSYQVLPEVGEGKPLALPDALDRGDPVPHRQ